METANYDMRVMTSGQVEKKVIRTIVVETGTNKVAIRFRFITWEKKQMDLLNE